MISPHDTEQTNAWLEQAARGGGQGLGALLDRDRLDRRLQGRIDPGDVIAGPVGVA